MAKVFKLPANTGNYPVKGFLPCHLSVQVILVICQDLMSVSVTGDPTGDPPLGVCCIIHGLYQGQPCLYYLLSGYGLSLRCHSTDRKSVKAEKGKG